MFIFFLSGNILITKVSICNPSLLTAPAPTEVIDPCNPSPCGSNAVCNSRTRAAACQCIPEYFGDPYVACRPECTINADCPSNKACQNLHCVDPCPGVCGVNANCKVINHNPTCTCNPGYRGDPFTACSLIPQSKFYVGSPRQILQNVEWQLEKYECKSSTAGNITVSLSY